MSFRRAFPLSFCFSFLRLSGFHVGGKTGFSASLLHGKKSFFRLLVQVARKFCGHWKIAFSRMNFYSAESDSGKCRIGAKDALAAWLFVNVWLLMAGVSVFGAMV
jgi:hypothetical protein